MRVLTVMRTSIFFFATVAALMIGSVSGRGAEPVGPRTTPPGVTRVEVTRELQTSSDQLLWVRLGSEAGATLLISHDDAPDVSSCVDACSGEFPPLRATPDAVPFGDWSLVARADGQPQWAYRSHPLYTWTAEEEPGEVATNVGLVETAGLKTADRPVEAGSLLPPPGWEVARFDPMTSIAAPVGIEATMVPTAQAVVLTDFEGRTLYAFDGDPRDDGQACTDEGCELRWLPVATPALAREVGDFTVVVRADGSRQWAYNARPLYRFSGDLLPGDVHGRAADARWRAAALTHNIRPKGVAVFTLPGYGDVLTLDGRTLYTGSAFEKYWGGRNLRDSFRVAYFRGKRLGGNACVDEACLQMWHPFRAPVGARSHGFWEVITRGDGTAQWAYKGFALYTYAGDTASGQNRGQAIYTFIDPGGRSASLERVAMLANIGNAGGGAGVYWHIAKP